MIKTCDSNLNFSLDDATSEGLTGTKLIAEIIIYEKSEIVWKLRVIRWDVSYKAEFAPEEKDAYTVVIWKPRKMKPFDELVLAQSFIGASASFACLECESSLL